MQHPINISVLNDAVGIPVSSDGVMGLFCKAVAVASTFQLDKAYLLSKLSDLDALGIDAAYDAANNVAVYQQVSEFYSEAGDGALLWLFGVDKAAAFATYVAGATFASLIRYTAQADPANRVKMIGLCYDVPTATQSAADFPADVLTTIANLQTAQSNLFGQGFQWSAILDGYNMSTTATPAGLGTMANKASYAVSLCITGTKPNGISAVGLALGRFARISVGHGFGAVEDGPRNTNGAFLTNSVIIPTTGTLTVGKTYTAFGGKVVYNGNTYEAGQEFVVITGHTSYTTTDGGVAVDNYTSIADLTPGNANGTGDIDYLGKKQFMFLRTWFNHSGYFWNDGATCEDPTKQLSTQEYNRVANALSADALAFFINEMGKNLPLDIKTGAVAQNYLNAKQSEFYDRYIEPLNVASGTGDLTEGQLILTGPNFAATKTLNFTLKIVPTPILGAVNGTIQFTSTL